MGYGYGYSARANIGTPSPRGRGRRVRDTQAGSSTTLPSSPAARWVLAGGTAARLGASKGGRLGPRLQVYTWFEYPAARPSSCQRPQAPARGGVDGQACGWQQNGGAGAKMTRKASVSRRQDAEVSCTPRMVREGKPRTAASRSTRGIRAGRNVHGAGRRANKSRRGRRDGGEGRRGTATQHGGWAPPGLASGIASFRGVTVEHYARAPSDRRNTPRVIKGGGAYVGREGSPPDPGQGCR